MKRKNAKYILTIVLLSLSFTFFAFSMGILDLKRSDSERVAMDQGNVYLGLQHETNPLELADSTETLDGFKDIFSLLQALPYKYYELYQQPLDCSADQGTFFDAYFQEYRDSCEHAQCVQISENIQADFNLPLMSGRLLRLEDYEHTNGSVIPVLMGCDYSKTYKIGDTFSGNYLFSPFTFEIVGFLSEGSCISSSTVYIDLDRCIVMPSFDFVAAPDSSQEYITQKIHYANKTSGKLRVPLDQFDDAYSVVQDIMTSSTVGLYSVTSSSFGSISHEKGFDLNVWLVISGLCCTVFLFLNLHTANRIMKKKQLANALYKRGLTILSTILSSFVISIFPSTYLLTRIGIYYHITLPMVSFFVLVCFVHFLINWQSWIHKRGKGQNARILARVQNDL